MGGIMKVCVYAIAKNEEKFALRWIKSMQEADEVIVLDTGSTDKTVQILKENGAILFKTDDAYYSFPEDTIVLIANYESDAI